MSAPIIYKKTNRKRNQKFPRKKDKSKISKVTTYLVRIGLWFTLLHTAQYKNKHTTNKNSKTNRKIKKLKHTNKMSVSNKIYKKKSMLIGDQIKQKKKTLAVPSTIKNMKQNFRVKYVSMCAIRFCFLFYSCLSRSRFRLLLPITHTFLFSLSFAGNAFYCCCYCFAFFHFILFCFCIVNVNFSSFETERACVYLHFIFSTSFSRGFDTFIITYTHTRARTHTRKIGLDIWIDCEQNVWHEVVW